VAGGAVLAHRLTAALQLAVRSGGDLPFQRA
jgi:hypothetical protein